jgi:peptidoglycan-N-acetylglucosamine deacetylase
MTRPASGRAGKPGVPPPPPGSATAMERRLSLTFDDGPDPRGTPAVLDALARAGARGTFFVMAPSTERHPDLFARILAEGHTIGLHCDEHVRHTERDRDWVTRDAVRALGRLAAAGVHPSLWRVPWGRVAQWSAEVAADLGLRLVDWTSDTHDWRGDRADAMFAAVRDELVGGAIVLAHDGVGPGARRADCAETAAFVNLAAAHAADHGLGLTAL